MNYIVSKIISQDGSPFIEASDGSIEFGFITSEQNLHPAPIRLVLGNEDNGLIHIIKRHGEQIKNAGYESVVSFVEYVAKHYNRILLGNAYKNKKGIINQSYLVQLTDEHNNTLWVQLSNDKTYWNVNSAGVLSKRYGNKKKTSGLLPNCRMRNRLPVILRNLQQMPIKRQVQTVLYPMFLLSHQWITIILMMQK